MLLAADNTFNNEDLWEVTSFFAIKNREVIQITDQLIIVYLLNRKTLVPYQGSVNDLVAISDQPLNSTAKLKKASHKPLNQPKRPEEFSLI